MAGDDDPLSPDEAFRLLGDETRTAILKAVWESAGTPVSFSEIRARIGSPDSGKFNYHLNRLRGHFLAKSDDRDGEGEGDGYVLTQAGREVVRAVLAGTMTERPATEPAPIDATCVHCDGSLVVRYDEYARIECADCGATTLWNEFPPAGLDGRSPPALARAVDRWTASRFRLAAAGVCPNCAAGTTTTLVAPPPDPGPDDGTDASDVATRHRCPNCGHEARVPLVGHVLSHPAVVAFYHERGVDVTEMPYWEMQALEREFSTAIDSGEPWRVTVTIESGGRSLAVTLDDRLDVVDVVRSGD